MELSHRCTLCRAGGGKADGTVTPWRPWGWGLSVAKELRDFREFLVANTVVEELRGLNLLGIQFALCEASKWLFYLRSSFVSVMEIWPLAQSLLRGKRLGIRFPSPPGAFPAYWRRSMSRVCG